MGRSEKNECHRYLPGGGYYVSCQKDFVKWNMPLRAQF